MGSAMAQNIQNAGYAMVAQHVREEATRPLLEGAARLGASPAEVAAQCEATFTPLPGPRQVERCGGILAGIKEGHLYLGPRWGNIAEIFATVRRQALKTVSPDVSYKPIPILISHDVPGP